VWPPDEPDAPSSAGGGADGGRGGIEPGLGRAAQTGAGVRRADGPGEDHDPLPPPQEKSDGPL
jgi:hypothetical protein